ncbi:F-box only protein 44 [Colletes latitarsis]|uniref:F-box only protein 44 n=1 Tax=Colletes latitarsis TaxID=2605962 RepID=UPI0040372719
MGQFHDNMTSNREEFDEKSENGLILADKYLPQELLAEIFCYLDNKSLLNCQLVCVRWKILIQSYVWRKKANILLGRLFLLDEDVHWHVSYLICKKKPFEKNLIKNHSGEHGIQKYWKILSQGGDQWAVENPPQGVPALPSEEPLFGGKQVCFSTSYHHCSKMQTIDLVAAGLSEYVLDTLQPSIVVSEWYSCRWDCPAVYECAIKLFDNHNEVIDSFKFRDIIEGEKQNKWHKVSHEFTNYGPGLRKILFYHGGSDRLFWAGHYGSKMAGACVYIKIPTTKHSENEESTLDID